MQPEILKQQIPGQPPVPADASSANPLQLPKKANQLFVWAPFFIFLFLFTMVSFMIFKKITAKPTPRIAPTPEAEAPTPTPTPYRALSSIATTSAYTALEAKLSSYAQELSTFAVVDPNVVPPVLVLPLDFKK